MKIWLTTDTHFGHTKLIEYGRISNFEEKIKKGLRENIKPEDLLIHLGDVCIGNDAEHNHWFDCLGCKRYLIIGNHDRKSISWYLDNGWTAVGSRIDIELFGKKICFTHQPVAWDGYFDINIHGHFHDTDHRRFEPEFNRILSGYNKLLALEKTNYQPVLLEKFIIPPATNNQSAS